MNKTTLAALKASIRHWERMRDNKPKGGEKPYSEHCALCRKFYERDCKGCPVFAKTGYSECENSPYYNAKFGFETCGMDSQKFSDAAQAEIDFLKSLLPKDADT